MKIGVLAVQGAFIEHEHIIAVKYKNQIGLSFHPELSDDTRIHEYFLDYINSQILSRQQSSGLAH